MLYDATLIANMETNSGNSYLDTLNFGVPKLEKLGDISTVKLIFYWEMDGAAPSTSHGVTAFGGALSWTWSDTNAYVVTELDFTSSLSDAEKDEWDLESQVVVTLNDNTSDVGQILRIKEAAIEIEYKLKEGFSKTIETIEYVESPFQYNTTTRDGFDGKIDYENERDQEKIVTHKAITAPAEVSLLYVSAKGRKFGSWIDSGGRSNGYSSGSLIQNPVYIIEDILRRELGLSTSDIDIASFDAVGNTTNGTLATAFNDAMVDIKFAFSQYKSINAFSLIEKICKQAGIYFFTNESGQYSMKQRLKAASYSSADRTIDFNDCLFKGFKKTNINSVKNNIEINYQYDYGSEQTLSTDTSTDSTSKSNYSTTSKERTLELDADCIQDKTTAQNLGDCYLDWLKDRKVILDMRLLKPKYLDLEIGDTVNFSNFPSDLKAYGSAVTTSDYFIVNEISKTPNSIDIKCTEVS